MVSKLFESARRGEARAKGAVRAISSQGYASRFGQNWWNVGAEGVDYNKEAGARWDSSIVYPIISALATALTGCQIITVREDGDGNLDPIEGHPITRLLDKPMPWPGYDGALLETASIFGEASRGNSFVYKHRSAGGKLIALEVLPEGTCYPYVNPGSGDWISYYRVSTYDGYREVPPDDVMQIRWMTPNPQFPQLGMSPLEACLPDLVSDKLSAKHEASLLNKSAVSSLMAMPKQFSRNDSGDIDVELTDTQAQQLQRRIDARLTGDAKGSSFVWNIPMDVQQLGFDPKQLALIENRMISESRICACFGIPPVVVGLMAGLEKSNNRASYEAAVDQFFDALAIPYMRHRGRQLTEHLIPELGYEGEKVVYDESKIPAIKSRMVRQLMDATGGPLLTPNEGRAELGRSPVEGGDTLRGAKSQQATSAKTTNGTEPDEDDTE